MEDDFWDSYIELNPFLLCSAIGVLLIIGYDQYEKRQKPWKNHLPLWKVVPFAVFMSPVAGMLALLPIMLSYAVMHLFWDYLIIPILQLL